MLKTAAASRAAIPGNVEREPSARGALASLALAMLLSSLGTSIANVALPTLAKAFAAPFHAVQWVVLAYLLAVTTLIVSAGRMGDELGRRRMLLAGMTLFTLASAACGLAGTLGVLIAARIGQGAGAALMMSLAVALVGDAVPRARTGSAMGLLGTTSAIGTALGPSLGGLLIALAGWRWVFLAQATLGAVTLWLAARRLPVDPRERTPGGMKADKLGTLLLALLLAAYALSMTVGRGDSGHVNLPLLAAAGAGCIAFLSAEARAASPLVPLSLFRDPALAAALAMSMLVSTVLMATLVVGPFYLTRGLGLDSARVGLILSVGPLVAAASAVPAGRIVDALGAGRTTGAGLAAIAAGSAALAIVPAALGVVGFVLPIVVITGGYALFQTANNTAVMRDVVPGQRGVVSGMLNLSRNLGLITGTSAMGAVFAAASGTRDVSVGSAESVATGLRITFAVAAVLAVGALAISFAGAALSRHVPRPGAEPSA